MQTRQHNIKFWQTVCVCFSCSVGRLLSIIPPFGPNTVCSSSCSSLALVLFRFLAGPGVRALRGPGPRGPHTEKTLLTYACDAGAATRLSARGESLSVVPKCQSTPNLNITRCRNFGNITFQFTVQSRQNSWSFIIGSCSSPVLRVWGQSSEFLCRWWSNRISLPTWM